MPIFASVACIGVVGLGGVCSVGERGEGVPRGDVSGAVGVELDGRGPDAASHGDARAIRHQSILALFKGRVCDLGKGAADKKSPQLWTRSVRTAHPVRAGASNLVGPATARRPPSPRRGLLLHGGPPFVHHRCSRRSIDSAAFVRAKFLCVSTLVGAGHESLRAKLPRPSMC